MRKLTAILLLSAALCPMVSCAPLTPTGAAETASASPTPAAPSPCATAAATASAAATPQPTASPAATPAPTPTPTPATAEVHLLFTGDLMFHDALVSSAKAEGGYDFNTVFERLAPAIGQADFAIGNLEAPVADPEKCKTGTYQFAAPPQAIADYAAAGFDVFTTANNHAIDQGGEGVSNTIDTIEALGLKVTGTWRSEEERTRVCMLERNDVRVAVLACGIEKLNGGPYPKGMGQNPCDIDEMKADVLCARQAGADAVIVCVHFGNEYTYTPSPHQKRIVEAMKACGALAVIGHHPHVLQGMRVDADGKFAAAYSLGNLVTVTSTKRRQFAALLKLTVRKDPDGSVAVSELSYIPTWSRMLKGADGKKHVRVQDIRRALEACRNGTDPEIPKGFRSELETGLEWIRKILGEGFLDTADGVTQ